MYSGLHNSRALENKQIHTFIKMKATFANWTVREMLLHNNDFLGTEFPINVEMKTSNSFITAYTVIHNTYPPALTRPIYVSVHSNINVRIFIPGAIRTFIPGAIRIYCYKTSQRKVKIS